MSFGTLLYGPMTQVLIDTYGWRGAMMILGSLTLHLVPCAAVAQTSEDRNKTRSYRGLPVEDCAEHTHASETSRPSDRNPCKEILATFDFAVLADVHFIFLTLAACTVAFCFVGWAVYVVPHAIVQGLTSIQASFLPTAYGLGNILGKMITPSLLQKKAFGDRMIMVSGGLLCCIFFLLDPFVTSFACLMLVTGALGLGNAVFTIAKIVVYRSMTTDDHLLGVYSWQGFFLGAVQLLSGFASGRHQLG